MEKLAEFIGILLGDGSLKFSRSRRLKISLHSIDDLEYSKYISKLIMNLFNLTPIVKKRPDENTLDLFVFRKSVLNPLKSLGMIEAPKKDRAIIPSQFMVPSLNLFVLKGLFDTDGCVALVNNNGTLYPRLELKVCRSPFQSQIRSIVESTSLRSCFYFKPSGEMKLQINGVTELKKWYDLIGFSNPKHRKKAELFL